MRSILFRNWLFAGLFVLHFCAIEVLAKPVKNASASFEAVCREVAFVRKQFTVCSFDPGRDDLRLFWRNPEGDSYGSIPAVNHQLEKGGRTLVFAMAGGMFHSDSTPVGLYKEGGKELHAINKADGLGNFFTKPNGVFYFGKRIAGILETDEYLKADPIADYAVQAGPMLVINGSINSKFHENDPIEKPRSGVGVNRTGQVVFAYSNNTANLHQFASLFRDQLDCQNALHLDSASVSVFVPSLGRSNNWLPIGPILGVTRKINKKTGR